MLHELPYHGDAGRRQQLAELAQIVTGGQHRGAQGALACALPGVIHLLQST